MCSGMVKQKAGDYVDEKTKLIIAAVVIIFGANTCSMLNAVNTKIRADSFSGTEGNILTERLEYVEGLQRIVREEQVKVLLRLQELEQQQDENTKDLRSRSNIRWNKPDQEIWIENTERINEGWRGANPKHGR